MAYADFAYYTDTYLGNAVQEADFPSLALRASSFLDYYTQGRAAKHQDMEAIKMACCALAEQIQTVDASQALAQKALTAALSSSGGEIQSESVGSYSVSRRSGGDSAVSAAAAAKSAQEQLAAIVKRYLAGTGLIYRGGCCKCSNVSL